MKKIVLSFLLIFICPILSFGQSNALLKSYKIPTYSYHSIKINSQDFLNYWNSERPSDNGSKEWCFNINLRLDETVVKQTPRRTSKTEGFLLLYDTKEKTSETFGEEEDSSGMYIEVASTNDWYLGNERGAFFHLGFNVVDILDFTSSISVQMYGIPVGLGYGRIIGVKNVVQSYIIAKELGSQLSDEMLLELAELIEKYDNGYYDDEFKDNSEIEFYKDIATLTGKPEQSMKVKQILDSPLYKTSERFIGWHVKFGIYNYYISIVDYDSGYWGSSSASDYEGDLFALIEYALPINLNKQFLVGLSYLKNLGEGDFRHPHYGGYTSFTVDHKFTWSSTIGLFYEKADRKDQQDLSNLILSLRTDYALFNRLSLYASIDYQSLEFVVLSVGDLGGVLMPLAIPMQRVNIGECHLGLSFYIK